MENWDNFVEYLKDNRVGVLATAEDTMPDVRAMVFITMSEKNVIYTASDLDSRKVAQIRKNSQVCVYSWKDHTYFRVKGTAEVIEDVEIKKQVLEANPNWKKRYSEPENPDFCIIKIKVTSLEAKK